MSQRSLKSTSEPIAASYDCLMLDLDGVVYRGGKAVDGVPAALDRARELGLTLTFVTNNAARPPDAVATHLTELGIDAQPSDVVTSAQAAAHELATMVDPGSAVLVVGGEGLVEALTAVGLRPVTSADDAVAVAQGFHPSIGWKDLAEGAYALRRGVPWVASNLDLTVPTARGIAPGNGTLVNALAAAAGRRPDVVAGKPFRPLFDETVRRVGSARPLVVGDRLDTDIEGAVTCGADSMLVMTGVTDLTALCHADDAHRPDFVAWTMEGLFQPHPAPQRGDAIWELGGWRVELGRDGLITHARGDDRDEGLRVVTVACWDAADRGQDIPDLSDVLQAG